jgi:glycosyltransferase involved in cell wall biosynthesis
MQLLQQSANTSQVQGRRFSIAMATFNGEAYIREQLSSLATQILLPYELVVCDDGSSDRTVDILQEFRDEAPFLMEIYQNPRRLGFADNFLQAASRCNGEWVAFCDQDDIWFPEKLLWVNEAIQNSRASDLVLVTHCVQLVSEDFSPNNCQSHSNGHAAKATDTRSAAALGGVKMLHSHKDRTIGPGSHPGFWVLPGFTCVFRRELVACFDWRVRPRSYDGKDPSQGHDRWICMLANSLGSVHHIAKALVFYRRHDAALTGYYERKSLGERIALSRQVGAERYAFMADVARESAVVLSALAQSTARARWSENLLHTEALFEKLASNYANRAEIYSERGMKKFASLFKLVANEGYFGNAFCSLGMSSFLKDLVRCLSARSSIE